MNLRFISKLLVIVAFYVAVSSVSTAQASVLVVIDCHGTGGNPNWSHTSSSISATVRIQSHNNQMRQYTSNTQYVTVPASKCDQDGEVAFWLFSFTAYDVAQVAVTTSGSDAFWIDRVTLYESESTSSVYVPNPTTAAQWGIDNNFGYCLSTDANDGANSYCTGGLAQTTWYFHTGF